MKNANTVIAECASTNDLARELAQAGAPHGTWISARRQTSGRGRAGREWESAEGNLFLSVVARPVAVAWSWIPLTVAVGVAESLRTFNPKLEVEIKWPNDLWLERKKLGGILCEAAGGYVVIGLGLNCAHSPKGLDQETTSLTEHLTGATSTPSGWRCDRIQRAAVTADDVRLMIVSAIVSAIDDLARDGAPAMKVRYEKLAALKSGARIEWGSDSKTMSGAIQSTGESGELLVRTGEGVLHGLFAEDVKIVIR